MRRNRWMFQFPVEQLVQPTDELLQVRLGQWASRSSPLSQFS